MSWSPLDADPVKSPTPGLQTHVVRFVGGAAAVTKETGGGEGITVTYVGSGVVNLVWAKSPGTFVGAIGSVQAATPNNVDTYTVTFDTFDTSTNTLPLTLSEGGTPTDLAAGEYCTCVLFFYRKGTY
jgi:hypothetical protein